LILVEGLTCTRNEAEFRKFIHKARRIGTVVIGRRIAVVIKGGAYTHDPQRMVEAAQANALQASNGAGKEEEEGDEADNDGADGSDDL